MRALDQRRRLFQCGGQAANSSDRRGAKPGPFGNDGLMKGRRIPTFHLCQFAEKRHVSVEWLIAGDLKGRLRMARNEIAPQQPVLDPWYEVEDSSDSLATKNYSQQR
jgi:hypothetical protein